MHFWHKALKALWAAYNKSILYSCFCLNNKNQLSIFYTAEKWLMDLPCLGFSSGVEILFHIVPPLPSLGQDDSTDTAQLLWHPQVQGESTRVPSHPRVLCALGPPQLRASPGCPSRAAWGSELPSLQIFSYFRAV